MAEQYNSNFTGPEIDAILGNAVRYDLAQSLTTAQQTQARGNINAAPGGFGLGEVATIPEGRSANNITANGFYYCDKDTPNSNDWIILHIQRADSYAVQFGRTYNQDSGWPIVTRVLNANISNAWQPWEYVNPPMKLGVEYRTTERYLGKPVYAKLINLGKLPNNAETSVQDTTIGKIAHIVDFRGEFTNSNGTPFLLPYGPTFANSNAYTVCITVVSANSAGTGLEIRLLSKVDFSAFSATALVKYTKTTD